MKTVACVKPQPWNHSPLIVGNTTSGIHPTYSSTYTRGALNMTKPYDIAVVIGRFQIPHKGHTFVLQKAADIADKVVVLIGSVGQPRTPKNPFSFDERGQMLRPALDEVTNYDPRYGSARKYTVLPVRDQRYNTQHWIVDVVNKVNSVTNGWTDRPPKVALVGHKKDASSFYLDLFPQWKFIEVNNTNSVSSTDIRNALFNGAELSALCPEFISRTTAEFLGDFKKSSKFDDLIEEYKFLRWYKDRFSQCPYPPTFNTVDAVVVQSGHILLIERKEAPGKGLLALPGGFLEQDETLRQGVIRELIEETKIKIQPIILDRSIRKERTFDSPDRSQRGRTITQAFYIELTGHELPRIRGGSDAKKAVWYPLNEVFTMGEKMYEDHLDIILNMTGDR